MARGSSGLSTTGLAGRGRRRGGVTGGSRGTGVSRGGSGDGGGEAGDSLRGAAGGEVGPVRIERGWLWGLMGLEEVASAGAPGIRRGRRGPGSWLSSMDPGRGESLVDWGESGELLSAFSRQVRKEEREPLDFGLAPDSSAPRPRRCSRDSGQLGLEEPLERVWSSFFSSSSSSGLGATFRTTRELWPTMMTSPSYSGVGRSEPMTISLGRPLSTRRSLVGTGLPSLWRMP